MNTNTAISGNTAFAINATGFFNYPPLPVRADNICNMEYLNRITRGDEKKLLSLVNLFFTEIQQELSNLDEALEKTNFLIIKEIAHKMKSAFAVLGINILEPVIKEMELLSISATSIENIKLLSHRVHIVFNQARAELNISY